MTAGIGRGAVSRIALCLVAPLFLPGAPVLPVCQPQLEALSALCGQRARAQWAQILTACAQHGPTDKGIVTSMLREPPCLPLKRLVDVVLEEWELPSASGEFHQPRPVWCPPVEGPEVAAALAKLPVPLASFVVVNGRVGANGAILDAAVASGSTSQVLDGLVLNALKQCLFRPALGPNGFVEHLATVTWRPSEAQEK